MRRTLAAAFVLVCSLAAVQPAAGHVSPLPPFLESGTPASIMLSGTNERDEPMTRLDITAPEGVTIEHAHEVSGWDESLAGATASWTGGPLATGDDLEVGATITADVEPGPIELRAEQRYPSGAVVEWPVRITVTPGAEGSSQNLALAGVVGLVGVLLVVALALLAWRRRGAGEV